MKKIGIILITCLSMAALAPMTTLIVFNQEGEINAEDLNHNFSHLQNKITNLEGIINSLPTSFEMNYEACASLSVTHTIDGQSLVAENLNFEDSACAVMGCLVDSLGTACTDGSDCASPNYNGNPIDSNSTPGLCGELFQDSAAGYTGASCSDYNSEIACLEQRSVDFEQGYTCEWGGDDTCYDTNFDYLTYCESFSTEEECPCSWNEDEQSCGEEFF